MTPERRSPSGRFFISAPRSESWVTMRADFGPSCRPDIIGSEVFQRLIPGIGDMEESIQLGELEERAEILVQIG